MTRCASMIRVGSVVFDAGDQRLPHRRCFVSADHTLQDRESVDIDFLNRFFRISFTFTFTFRNCHSQVLFIRNGIPTGDTDTVFNLTDGDVGEGQRQGAFFQVSAKTIALI